MNAIEDRKHPKKRLFRTKRLSSNNRKSAAATSPFGSRQRRGEPDERPSAAGVLPARLSTFGIENFRIAWRRILSSFSN
jgi:hypothetical protein